MNTNEKQAEKAYKLLRKPETYPGLVKRAEFDRKLLLFRYPSFEPYTSWSLFNTKNTYWLRRVEWNRSLWFPSYEAEPYTYGCEVSFSSDLAKEILLSLSSISFQPFLQPEIIGIDGTTQGIEVGNYWFSCSLTWWSMYPENWKNLAHWFNETVHTFDGILPESTCKDK